MLLYNKPIISIAILTCGLKLKHEMWKKVLGFKYHKCLEIFTNIWIIYQHLKVQ